jgi:PKD repeat protein
MSQRVSLSLLIVSVLGLMVSCTQTPPPPPPDENKLPTAAFEATPTEGLAPLTVQFDASKSVDPEGKISEYRWSFGDDATDSGADKVKVSHTYDKPGQYKVTLIVKDDKGATDDFDLTITAKQKDTAPPPPKEVTDKTENEYVTVERSYPSEAKVGDTLTITLKATAKQNLAALLLSETIPSSLHKNEGDLKSGQLRVSKGQTVKITYKVTSNQEGKPELRGRALITLEDGTNLDLPLTTRLNIVK